MSEKLPMQFTEPIRELSYEPENVRIYFNLVWEYTKNNLPQRFGISKEQYKKYFIRHALHKLGIDNSSIQDIPVDVRRWLHDGHLSETKSLYYQVKYKDVNYKLPLYYCVGDLNFCAATNSEKYYGYLFLYDSSGKEVKVPQSEGKYYLGVDLTTHLHTD